VIVSYAGSARTSAVRLQIIRHAQRAVANPFVAYVLIAALQLRVIWNIWKYRDLTIGDSANYFVDAVSWVHGLHENVVYYPLYDAFWGTILAVVHNVYAAAIIHRVVIVLAATLLVLALMRAILGPALGLLIAAWWAVIPANFDVLYEVHLFGVLPILLAVLIVARVPHRQGLGIAIAIFLASAVLVRSELIAAAIILAGVVGAYEVREVRRGRRASRSSYLRAYVVPIVLACLLVGGAYARSHVQGSVATQQLKEKEETNFCESYAASYQQRHPTRLLGNPFTECSPLMQQTFGRPMPTVFQGVSANPKAVAGFAAWGAQLLPGGLQVALLGATAFDNDPGFRPVTENSTYAFLLAVILLIVVIAGLGVAATEGRLSLRRASARTRWILVTLASVAATDLLVILTTRPWAEYMYGLTICALALIGLSVSVLLRRAGAGRLIAPVALGTVIVLIVVFPTFYSPEPRPVYEAVQHLQVLRTRLQRPGSVLIAQDSSNELCDYLAYSYQRICTPVNWLALRPQVTARTSVGQVLDRANASAVYADAGMLADPLIAGLVAKPRAQGWRQIAHGSGPNGPWQLLVRADQSLRSQ
jgi:hypothetical protein